MATGFYTAASGMLMQQRALNVSGNNLANTKTPGFKTQRVVSNVFGWELLNRIENGDNLIGKGAAASRDRMAIFRWKVPTSG